MRFSWSAAGLSSTLLLVCYPERLPERAVTKQHGVCESYCRRGNATGTGCSGVAKAENCGFGVWADVI